jgi:hypothetical protein
VKILIQSARANYYLIATFAISCFYFISQSKWDPDPHHDGIMYVAALASSKGFVSNRDFFAQYGPITPELQGIWLSLFSPTLANLRLFSAFILISSCVLLFLILRKTVGDQGSFLLASTFALSNPLILNPTLPWSSNLATLFCLIFILLMDYKPKRMHEKTLIFIFSLTIIVGTLTRIHLIIGIPIVITLLLFSRINKKWIKGFQLATYTLVLAAISIVLMWKIGMLQRLYVDFVQWPLSWHSDDRTFRGFFNLKIVIFAITLAILFLLHHRFEKNVIVKRFLFTSLLFATIISGTYAPNFKGYSGQSFLMNGFHVTLSNFRFLITYSFVAITIWVIYTRLREIRELQLYEIFKIAFLAVGLAQLYPVPDVGHMWMVLPILITSLTLLPNSQVKALKLQKTLSKILMPLVIGLVVIFISEFLTPRIALTSPPLRGMSTDESATIVIDETIKKLGDIADSNSVRFECSDGLYATAGLKLLSIDRNFVNWGPQRDQGLQPKYIFACRQPDIALIPGYKLLFSDPGENIGEYNSLYLLMLEPQFEQ